MMNPLYNMHVRWSDVPVLRRRAKILALAAFVAGFLVGLWLA